MFRLLLEPGDAFTLIDADDPEAAAVGDRHFDRGKCGGRIVIEMEPQHLRVVHLVHVVAGEHDHVAR
jgi:hypothetical protein